MKRIFGAGALLGAAVLTAALTSGGAVGASPSQHLTKLRSVTIRHRDVFLLTNPQADARRHVVYVNENDHVLAINTATGAHTLITRYDTQEGILLNRSSGDLYTLNFDDDADDGLTIIRGDHVVKHINVGVTAGIDIGNGRVDFINEPADADHRARLLEYDGTTLVGKTPVCNNIPVQAAGGDKMLGYNSRTGLLYVACGEYLPKHKKPYQEIFKGTHLVKTLNRNVDADFVRVDPARNLAYVVGSSRVEVIHGTRFAGFVSLGRAEKYFPSYQNSGLSAANGDLYVGDSAPGSVTTVLKGTTVLGTVVAPARELVINQRTGIAYAEGKTGKTNVITLLSGPHVVGQLTTTATLALWDPVSGDEIGGGPDGLVAIHGQHVVQTVSVGASPRAIIEDTAGKRIYTVSGTTVSILRTSS